MNFEPTSEDLDMGADGMSDVESNACPRNSGIFTCCMPRFTRELKRRCTDGCQTLQPLKQSVSLLLGPSTGAGYPLVNA